MKLFADDGTITFHCQSDMFGVVAPPIRASELLPEWYRKLPSVDQQAFSAANNALTIKRCMPFQDAMITGWILVTPVEIRFTVNADGTSVTTGSDMPFQSVLSHQEGQIHGAPQSNRVSLKFIMPWVIKTPPGWSTMFLPLLNRDSDQFEVMSAIVDTDKLDVPVNIPFFLKVKDQTFAMKKGTPICQIIPFKRGSLTAEVRARTPADDQVVKRQSLNLLSMTGWYRKFARAKR
jgi:hypothetical protein